MNNNSLSIIVVHKKIPYHIVLNADWTVKDLKEVLYKLTKVPPHEQKLLGLGGQLENGRPFKTMRIKEHQKVLLLGSDIERSLFQRALRDDEADLDRPKIIPIVTPSGAFDFVSLLPKEIQLLIFSYLRNSAGVHYGVGICMRVCKKWCEVTKDQFFWYNAFHQNWNLLYKVNEDWQIDWRLVYKKKWTLELNWKANRHHHYSFPHRNYVRCIACDTKMWHEFPNQKKLATGSGNLVYFWDMESDGGAERNFRGHKANISALETSGGIIISGDDDGNLLLWDRTRSPEILPWSNVSGELVATLVNVHKSAITCIKYDDHSLASSSLDGTVKVWDLNRVCLKHKLEVVPSQVEEGNRGVTYLQLNSNDLLTSAYDGNIKLWDLNSGNCQLKIQNGRRVSCMQQVGMYTVYSSSPEEDDIKLWDLRLPTRPAYSYPGFGSVNYFSYDGSKFVASAQLRIAVCPLAPDQTPLLGWTLPISIAEHYSLIFMSSLLVMATSDSVLVYDYDV